jgi:hypothetical protein
MVAAEMLNMPTLEKQKSQVSFNQQSQINNSNISNPPQKELQPVIKKSSNGIFSSHFGIETVIDNIRMSKGTKLIHNGLVRKEAAFEPMSQTTDSFRITKKEFFKL